MLNSTLLTKRTPGSFPSSGSFSNIRRKRNSTIQRRQNMLSIMAASLINRSPITTYRFSGHETFAFRYPWLPKALSVLEKRQNLFRNEEDAMVELGVGKNMVRSMRFWIEATGFVQRTNGGGFQATDLGELFFGKEGVDPFLEDIQTLWIMHWNIATLADAPLFAWELLFNRWQDPEFSEEGVIKAFRREAQVRAKQLSSVTLEQHFDVFLHTYLPTKARKGDVLEDNLDCPLTELELLAIVGERQTDEERREPIYGFRTEEKLSITPELFCWAVNDFRQKRHPNSKALSTLTIATGPGSPGRVFKIPEEDIVSRLEEIAAISSGAIRYQESVALPQVQFQKQLDGMGLLRSALKQKGSYV